MLSKKQYEYLWISSSIFKASMHLEYNENHLAIGIVTHGNLCEESGTLQGILQGTRKMLQPVRGPLHRTALEV